MTLSSLKLFIILIILRHAYTVYCPHYCRCSMAYGLRYVSCVEKGLISVDLDVPRTVQWLQLSNNSIYELRDNIFHDLGLEHIVELDLSGNAIQSIGLHAFTGLLDLHSLDLSRNHLYNILPGIFENNPHLTVVNFHGNPLRFIKKNQPFIVSSSISDLDISNCRLNHIPDSAFLSLFSITKLNLSSNHLGSLDVYPFEYLERLREIDISNNKIECNSEMTENLLWFEDHKIVLFGSSCSKSNLLANGVQKMEKMIAFDDYKTSSEDSNDYGRHPEEFGEYPIEKKVECICDKTNNSNIVNDILEEVGRKGMKRVNLNYDRWFIVLAFAVGLIVGLAVALAFWVSLECLKMRRRRRRRRTTSSLSYQIYESPPPSYAELFLLPRMSQR